MPRKLRLAYFVHSLRSDWNNGNAHFLRGLMRSMIALGHDVSVLEPASEWSIENLRAEDLGAQSLDGFSNTYPEIRIESYESSAPAKYWLQLLSEVDVVIVHEWNPPGLAERLLQLRSLLGFRLLFHDTHHRASSSPDQIALFRIREFDGVIAFGAALSAIYRDQFGVGRVWTLHEAADTSVFYPRKGCDQLSDVVWIGNWGDGERSREIDDFLLKPAKELCKCKFVVYGVRYPTEGIEALRSAGVLYKGYLPNLQAPSIYAAARLTLHIPRQHYTSAMSGIPTIRVFEALASGIPLISAPWQDTEGLFQEGDYLPVHNTFEMIAAIRALLDDPVTAAKQAERGLQRILERHTCNHRAGELTAICEEVLS